MVRKILLNKKFVFSLLILAPLFLVIVFGKAIIPNDPLAMDTRNSLKNASGQYPLGTDEYGRCIFSRLVLGIRPSMIVALGGTAIAFVSGTLLGIIAGYVNGKISSMIMRFIDIILCFPPILLAMMISALWGAGILNLIIVVGILYLPHFCRLAYSSALQVSKMEYVENDVSIGAGTARILLKAIIPNILSPLIIQISTTISNAILLESGLSFLGLGVQPPEPSWGLMIGTAKDYISVNAMYLMWPALCLCLTILAINLLGDALRDILDPKLNETI